MLRCKTLTTSVCSFTFENAQLYPLKYLNPGWKLAYVLKGWATPALLSTYSDERRSFAEELISLDKDVIAAMEADENAVTKYHKYDHTFNPKRQNNKILNLFTI